MDGWMCAEASPSACPPSDLGKEHPFLPLLSAAGSGPSQRLLSHTAPGLTRFLHHGRVLPSLPEPTQGFPLREPTSWLLPGVPRSPTCRGSCGVKGCQGSHQAPCHAPRTGRTQGGAQPHTRRVRTLPWPRPSSREGSAEAFVLGRCF